MPNLINIISVAPATITEGERIIACNWKSTDKRTISPANKYRAVIVPATIWSDGTNAARTHSNALAILVEDAIEGLAKDYLSSIVEQSNWMRTQVPQEDFTLASLLRWSEERAAMSGRLNGDAIKAWAEKSVTVKNFAATNGSDKGNKLVAAFTKLAGPNHGWTPEKAAKMLSTIFAAEDTSDTTGMRVMLRLESIRDKPQADAEDLF